MKKNKWYKSKGGWIGAVVGGIFAYYSWTINSEFISKIVRIFYDYTDPMQLMLPILLLPILGFIIGYFIQKKFFKKKR